MENTCGFSLLPCVCAGEGIEGHFHEHWSPPQPRALCLEALRKAASTHWPWRMSHVKAREEKARISPHFLCHVVVTMPALGSLSIASCYLKENNKSLDVLSYCDFGFIFLSAKPKPDWHDILNNTLTPCFSIISLINELSIDFSHGGCTNQQISPILFFLALIHQFCTSICWRLLGFVPTHSHQAIYTLSIFHFKTYNAT